MKTMKLAFGYAIMCAVCGAYADDAYIASKVYDPQGYGALSAANMYALDTGYIPGTNTAVFADFELLALAADVGWSRSTQIIFEATDAGTGSARIYVNSSGNIAWAFTDGVSGQTDQWKSTGIAAAVGTRYTMMIDGVSRKTVFTYGENTKTMDFTAARQTIQATTSIKLFCNADMDTDTNPAMTKLYAFKIYEAGELVRDYVPAIKGGRPGLYDRVGGGFLSNYKPAGVEFDYGGDIATVEDDPYIESDGTAFVNSRYFMNPDAKIEVDYALTDAETPSEYKYIFGAVDATSGSAIKTRGGFFVSSNGQTYFIAGDDIKKWKSVATGLDTRRRIAVLDIPAMKYHYYVHGQADVSGNLNSGATVTQTAAYPIALFGNMSSTSAFSASGFAKVRIYRAKFWDGETLVHDYVPCVQGELPGFKDLVDSEFVTAAGVANLTYGGNITIEAGPAYIANDKKAMFDTGFKPGPNSRIEMDYMCMTTNNADRIFGCYPNSVIRIRHYINNAFNYAWDYMDGSANAASLGLKVWPLRRRTFVIDSKDDFVGLITAGYTNYSASVSEKLSGKTPGTRTNTATGNLWLFAEAATTATNSVSDLRLYGCRVYDNGALVRDYIPYVKDGVAGLYDQVNDTFASSATNLYPFTAGGEIATNGRDDAYVEADGTQSFNTGYHMKRNARIEVDFRYMGIAASQNAIFGAWNCTNNKCGGYVNGNMNFAMWLTSDSESSTGLIKANTDRHTAILDGPTRKYYYITGTTTNKTATAKGISTDTPAEHPIGIFAAIKAMSGDQVTEWNHAQTKARIYSFRIYETENGVESLVHEYLPYKKDDTVGLYDTVTGTILTDARGSATPLVIGGKGVEGVETWLIAPQNRRLSYSQGTYKLNASAAGAVSYKWTKNGVAMAGGTNGEFAVSWVRGGATDTYTVTPIYDLYGREVEGAPVAATVENVPRGFVLVVQ